MKSRLWYPQLDISCAARRIMRILMEWSEDAPSVERLLILDFFVASPALIADIKMPAEYRQKFGKLAFPKRKDIFVTLPASSLLFHSMVPIQRKALVSLVAKNLIKKSQFDIGEVELTNGGVETAKKLEDFETNEVEDHAIKFLCELLSLNEYATKLDLRSRTELRHYE